MTCRLFVNFDLPRVKMNFPTLVLQPANWYYHPPIFKSCKLIDEIVPVHPSIVHWTHHMAINIVPPLSSMPDFRNHSILRNDWIAPYVLCDDRVCPVLGENWGLLNENVLPFGDLL